MGGVTWRKGEGSHTYSVCAVHTHLPSYQLLVGQELVRGQYTFVYLHIATAEVVITETEERERERRGGGRAMKQLVNCHQMLKSLTTESQLNES